MIILLHSDSQTTIKKSFEIPFYGLLHHMGIDFLFANHLSCLRKFLN